ncbi:MAG: hypothetical protein HKN95_11715, partial [Acidimicrobiia bacterium]|nr:hypothetical protein [Acidimicrobiia bacterium]
MLIAAGAVVLVVGGFTLSRDYGVQSIPATPDLEEVATPTTSSTTSPAVSVTNPEVSDSIGPGPLDWIYEMVDVAITSDGLVYVAAPTGVAWRGNAGDWVLVDVEGLPEGTGSDDGYPGRFISQIVAGPDDSLWATGFATSHADDVEFGGSVDGWTGGRVLEWVARYHCPVCGEWTVWTSDEVPVLGNGIGDLVVSSEGMVYASVGEDQLAAFDGQTWESHTAPIPTDSGGVAYPWSGSLAVGTDGVVWAGTNYHGQGVVAFDGTSFTRYSTGDGLPSGYIHRVAAGGDGTIWAVSDGAGVASFDGTTWTTHTTYDGLLSNDALIATGADDTVWAVHPEIHPF